MPWLTRGLREGIVTTRYPHRPDGDPGPFRSQVRILQPGMTTDQAHRAVELCPSGAIRAGEGHVYLDRGSCILCGRCVAAMPSNFGFGPGPATAVASRAQLVLPLLEGGQQEVEEVRRDLARRVKALKRSVHVRHIDAGSDGSEEWEIAALTGPIYDVQRLGIFLTASPRHADLLLVTGTGTMGMARSLKETYDGTPSPKVVIAVGTDAASGGLGGGPYGAEGGVNRLVPVDIFVPGSPPSPFSILYAILLAIGRLAPSGDGTTPATYPQDGAHGG